MHRLVQGMAGQSGWERTPGGGPRQQVREKLAIRAGEETFLSTDCLLKLRAVCISFIYLGESSTGSAPVDSQLWSSFSELVSHFILVKFQYLQGDDLVALEAIFFTCLKQS